MGVFDTCNSYQDYLNKLFEYLDLNSDFDLECYGYLCCLKDNEAQMERAIRGFKKIDSIKGETNNQRNLMLSRKSSFLAIGLLLKRYESETAKLTAEEIALLARGLYCDEDINVDGKMIKIVTDKRLLREAIRLNEETKKNSIFEEADIFFKIKQHYLKGLFDANDEKARESFISSMIAKMQDGSLGDGVPSILDCYMNNINKPLGNSEGRAIL